MAQSGFTPISLYYSSTGAAVPSAGNLVAGELALNTNDGKLYYKNSSGVVTLLAGATSGPAGGSTTQVQYNNAGVLAGITGATTNGTALTLIAPVLGTPASGNLVNATGYVGTSSLVTVGALNSGSITSGFGAIDVGADAISGGAATFTTGTFSSTVTATGTITSGPGGTAGAVRQIVIDGGSGTAGGAMLSFKSNSLLRAAISNESAIIGSGTSNELTFFSETGFGQKWMVNGSTTPSMTLSSASAVTMTGTLAVTGAVSGAAATFTTGSFSGTIAKTNTAASNNAVLTGTGSTTGYQFISLVNTSGYAFFGVNGSGNPFGFTNATDYSTVIGTNNAGSVLEFVTNSSVRVKVDTTGAVSIPGTLAVTGAVSGGAATLAATAIATSAGNGQLSVSTTGATQYSAINIQNSSNRQFALYYASTSYASALVTNGPTGESAAIGTGSNFPLSIFTNNTERIGITGAGAVTIPGTLAVTGATTATGGVFTASGSTGSIATATPTTIFAAGSSGIGSVFLVSAVANSVSAAIYTAYATVICDGTDTRIVSDNGAALTITLSGNNVQVTQTSGGNLTIAWKYLKIAN